MYGQNNEDSFARDFFSTRESNRTVLDIGANDGKTFSNSLLLIEDGWEGHLIEPSSTFNKCLELHADNDNVRVYPYGIAEEDNEMDFYESGTFEGDDANLVSCIQPKEMDRWRGSVNFEKTKAWFLTFNTFLKLEELEGKTFDFISIDVEGHDWIVLSQINLLLHKTKLLCVEWNSIPEMATKFIEYCAQYEMVEVHRNAENLIFANKNYLI